MSLRFKEVDLWRVLDSLVGVAGCMTHRELRCERAPRSKRALGVGRGERCGHVGNGDGMVWINHRREFVLVDSGSTCHVCPAAWVQRLSAGNKQFLSLTITTEPGELAPHRGGCA